MKIRVIQNIIVATLLSIVCNYIVYYGFTTNYTKNAFSKESFTKQYDHGVYKYRVLSKTLLIHINEILEQKQGIQQAGDRLSTLDESATKQFYLSYFLLNTFFLVLTSIVLALLIELKELKFEQKEKQLALFFLPMLISLSQFVITPYDVSSYFIHLFAMLVFIRFFDAYRVMSLAGLCILLFISALNRESAALSLAFVVLLIWLKEGFNRRFLISASLLTASFVTAYLLSRYYLGGPASVAEGLRLKSNFLYPPNIIGIIFWLLFFYLSLVLAASRENRYVILVYHLLCLPYIFACILTGILFEIRLYIPIFLGSVFLGKINTSMLKLQLESYLANLPFLRKRRIN